MLQRSVSAKSLVERSKFLVLLANVWIVVKWLSVIQILGYCGGESHLGWKCGPERLSSITRIFIVWCSTLWHTCLEVLNQHILLSRRGFHRILYLFFSHPKPVYYVSLRFHLLLVTFKFIYGIELAESSCHDNLRALRLLKFTRSIFFIKSPAIIWSYGLTVARLRKRIL